MDIYKDINEITGAIIGSAFDVRNTYGRLMLESFYEKVMEIELQSKGLQIRRQIPLDINHKNTVIHNAYSIDTLVESQIVVEYKAVPYMKGEEFRQLMTYLKLSGLKVGLLINFDAQEFTTGKFEHKQNILTRGIYRVINNL